MPREEAVVLGVGLVVAVEEGVVQEERVKEVEREARREAEA